MDRNDIQSVIIDRFYVEHGRCCAGCDWWRYMNSVVGECTRSAPVSGDQRFSMLGMRIIGGPKPRSGHILTNRAHICGEFKDEFDWKSLPLNYLRAIGGLPPSAAPTHAQEDSHE